jgi:hypothetical protein
MTKANKTFHRIRGAIVAPQLLNTKGNYLFIISHMRSRSSLLSHVLGSNSGICGYSELQIKYRNRFDLIKMKLDIYLRDKESQNGKYLLDKILHNRLAISDNIISRTSPKFIFMLREPVGTLKSIINMATITGKQWYTDQSRILDYYCDRLSGIEELCARVDSNYFFINSDDLITDTDHVLIELTKWLGLDNQLDKQYSNFSGTGKAGFGDPSENISRGVIAKTREHGNITLDHEIIEAAESAYKQCRQVLVTGATTE